jgi:predicted glycoside hydrolase/deacetylase ChbG (UPF0249 family)
MRLIINADDVGKDPQVNAVIFDLIDRRLVTSATIMANGPALEECLDRIQAYPLCSFGVHLNITEFQPLTPSAPLAELLDPQGNFCLAIYRRARLHRSLRKDILLEWSAQVQRLCSYGLKVSHIDSHHDVHTDPRLFFILKHLQRSFGIRKVRIAPNISLDPKVTCRKNRLWNLALRHLYATTTTSGFTNFTTFLQVLDEIARRHPTVELMVHPGHPRFAAETRAMQTPWMTGLPFAIRLISYYEL